MNKPIIFQLLETFTQTELEQFRDFLTPPFFNKNPTIIQGFKYITQKHPNYDSKMLSKERVFNYLYPELDFKERKIRDLWSDLANFAKEFLAYQEMKKNKTLHQSLITQGIEKKNVEGYFFKEMEKMKEVLEKSGIRDTSYYQYLLQIQTLQYFHPLIEKFSKEEQGIYKLLNHLDHFYILSKLRFSCEAFSREVLFEEEVDILFLDEILTSANQYDEPPSKDAGVYEHPLNVLHFNYPKTQDLTASNPLFQLYTDIIFFIKNTKEIDGFKELIERFFAHRHLLSIDEQSNILGNLINLAYWKNRGTDNSMIQNILDLYDQGLATKVMFQNDGLTDTTFTNYITVASFLGKFDQAENFIKRYSKYVSLNYRNDAKTLGLAYLYFHQGDFKTTDKYLKANKYKNKLYEIRARTLLIRNKFEFFLKSSDKKIRTLRGGDDDLKREITNFQKTLRYLKKKENQSRILNNNKIQAYLNLLSIILLVLKACRKDNKYILSEKQVRIIKEKMTKKIKNSESIIAHGWILKKLKELSASC